MHSLNLKTITEAGISFNIPEPVFKELDKSKAVPRKSDPVFYNPKQNMNRDLSLMVLHAVKDLQLSKLEHIAETFSGTGIRALRYAVQGPELKNIFINDISPRSIDLTKEIFTPYQSSISSKIHYYNLDAKLFFLKLREEKQFLDFIDIDPYGTPQPYIRNALLTLEQSGVLAVTATDMPVVTGLYPEKAYRMYQIPNYRVHNRSYCHEIGLRMIIAYLQREALFYKMPMDPLVSFYADHYVRVFMHHTRTKTVDKIIQNHGYVNDCQHCNKRQYYSWKQSFKWEPVCSNCQKTVKPIGPIYLGPLHNSRVIDQLQTYLVTFPKKGILDRRYRLERLIPLFKNELEVDEPWFYNIGDVGKNKYFLSSPKLLVQKIREKGFKASLTHFEGQAIKTNFPLELEGEIFAE